MLIFSVHEISVALISVVECTKPELNAPLRFAYRLIRTATKLFSLY